MVEITLYQWKQLIEGAYRQDASLYEWLNLVEGNDTIREYRLKSTNTVTARMRTIDGVKNKAGCVKFFEADPYFLPLVEHIYIPTDEEYEEWNQLDLNPAEEIAKRETPP